MKTAAIQKNVPIPPPRQTGITALLKQLKVGESVIVDTPNRGSLHGNAKNIGIKIVTRKEGSGFRVWRVS